MIRPNHLMSWLSVAERIEESLAGSKCYTGLVIESWAMESRRVSKIMVLVTGGLNLECV